MEPRRRREMIRGAAPLLAALFLAAQAAAGQSARPFYDVGRELRIEGTVADIRLEPRYNDRAPFLVVILEEAGTGKNYVVEVSPVWFLNVDVHKGERMKVLGSLTGTSAASGSVLAREFQCGGETIAVRDRNGFPNWSGGRAGQGFRRRRGASG